MTTPSKSSQSQSSPGNDSEKSANRSQKAWGGRFGEELDDTATRFSASVQFDKRLALEDIRGSLAHVRMLGAQGILKKDDASTLERGLLEMQDRVQEPSFAWQEKLEDVHMNIETALTAQVGPLGGKLHTARSRNDQVATDMRMWVRKACDDICGDIDLTLQVLVERAREHVDTLMPGYTHLQRAQPVRLAHHLLAWCEMFERDRARFVDARDRLNECPLGSGALAGTPFPIDREATAKELSFRRPTRNSLDTVADRDFLIEVLGALSNCAVHLSRMSEELVLWSSQEFSFVEMSDTFATGSSMMPQKKNPDMAELIRGKAGRVVGSLVSLLVTMKGLPLAYNRDMQEDKEPVFDAVDTVRMCLKVFAPMMAELRFCSDNMRAALHDGYVEATELADYLAAKQVPFREAHRVAGEVVAYAIERKQTLAQVSLEELQRFHKSFENDVFAILDHEYMVERRAHLGAPAKAQVESVLAEWKKLLDSRVVPAP